VRALARLQVAAETRAYLEGNGVDLTGKQQTKTKAALGYFSRELQAAAAESTAS
jgi:hypothetical protein